MVKRPPGGLVLFGIYRGHVNSVTQLFPVNFADADPHFDAFAPEVFALALLFRSVSRTSSTTVKLIVRRFDGRSPRQ